MAESISEIFPDILFWSALGYSYHNNFKRSDRESPEYIYFTTQGAKLFGCHIVKNGIIASSQKNDDRAGHRKTGK
jgi:hypothetical protein